MAGPAAWPARTHDVSEGTQPALGGGHADQSPVCSDQRGATGRPAEQGGDRAFREPLADPLRHQDRDLVFMGEPGRDDVRRPHAFNKAWLEIKAKEGLEDLRLHDLRHEIVNGLVEVGLSDPEVSATGDQQSLQALQECTDLHTEDLVA